MRLQNLLTSMCEVDSGIHHMIIFTRLRVIHTASDDSCGSGLGTRLHVRGQLHSAVESNHLCQDRAPVDAGKQGRAMYYKKNNVKFAGFFLLFTYSTCKSEEALCA